MRLGKSKAQKPGAGSRTPKNLALVALVLVTWAVYYPVKDFQFINFDDPGYVFDNPRVAQGLSWDNTMWALTTGHQSNWHPLTWLSHMLDSELYGVQNAGGHHITNVVLHVVNSVLVWVLLQRMTAAFWRSLFVAAIFALHPLHVESVAWVSERKDVLSACLGLACLVAYVEYAGRRGGRQWLAAAGVLLALGLMAKPMLVTIPLVMLLLDFWPLQRWNVDASGGQAQTANAPSQRKHRRSRRQQKGSEVAAAQSGPTADLKSLLLEKVPLLLLIVASSVVTYFVQSEGGAVGSIPWQHRLSTSLIAYARYLWKTFVPTHLALLYPNHADMWSWWQVVGAALLLVAVTAFVVSQRTRPYLAVGWLWFAGMLFPVCGIIQIGLHSLADRYMYLPMIGVLVMVAWGAHDVVKRWPAARSFVVVTAVAAVCGCVVLTARQVAHWQDSLALFGHTVAVTKRNHVMHNNLGDVYQQQQDLDQAIEHYQQALAIQPDFDKALTNLGNALRIVGKTAEAEQYLRRSVTVSAKNAVGYNNLGILLQERGRVDEAIANYRQALEIDPQYTSALNNLGIALFRQQKTTEALVPLREAVQIAPNDAVAHNSLAAVYQSLGRLEDAIAHCQTALRIQPDDASAHGNLGICLIKQNKLAAAIQHFRRAVEIEPNDKLAQKNLELAEQKLRSTISD